jgi:hypothetical protein
MKTRTQAPWMRPGDYLVVAYNLDRLRCVVTEETNSVDVIVARVYANGEAKECPNDIHIVVNGAELLEWWRGGKPRYIEPYWHPKPP